MKIAVGTDMDMPLARFVVEELKKMGHEVTQFGALVAGPSPWPKVAIEVAEKVAAGEFSQACFVSAESKTADIEKKLVSGVHGPKECIFVEVQ